MNLKQLRILLVLVVVLGGAGLILYRHQNASWQGGSAEMGKKLFANFPVNEVSRITITRGTNQLNLVKKDDLWRVQERHDYPANYAQIREFLLKAQELKVVQSEKVGDRQLAMLQLAPGQGTNSPVAVEFKAHDDKPIQTLLLGKHHLKQSAAPAQFGGDGPGWPDGRYVRTADSQTVAVISDPLENIEVKPDAWLNKDFIRIEKARTLEVHFSNTTNSWKLTRDTESADWKLADASPNEQLDATKAVSLSYPLSSLSFVDVLPGANLGDAGTNPPVVLKIETFDRFYYTGQIGQKTNDNYPLTISVAAQIPSEREPGKDEKPEDRTKLDKEFKDTTQKLEDKLKQEQGYGKWTFLVSSWAIDPLLKARSELLAEKQADAAKSVDSAGKPVGDQDEPAQTGAGADANPAN